MANEVRSWIFGTGDDCDVRVSDQYVSKRHCKVTLYDDGSAVVEDIGSVNGTWIRSAGTPEPGIKLGYWSMPIRRGMIVRIGRTDIPWTRGP